MNSPLTPEQSLNILQTYLDLATHKGSFNLAQTAEINLAIQSTSISIAKHRQLEADVTAKAEKERECEKIKENSKADIKANNKDAE